MEKPLPLTELKQKQFNAAMAYYENKYSYTIISRIISVINISFQILLLYIALQNRIDIYKQIIALAVAYFLADLVNGFIHMLMDNNDNYTSFYGPFVAAFHLHHRTPVYKKRNIFMVYFFESGSKIWLSFYFIGAAIAMTTLKINPVISYMLVYFGIFSCIAEVSHYFCHVSSSPTTRFLALIRFFLSKRHHGRHHLQDNNNYAFLNGMSDPLLNIIAKKYFAGYKTTTDFHYANYTGKGTANR